MMYICMLYKTTQPLQPFPLSHTQGHACANSCAPPPEAHPNALPVQVLCMKYMKIYQNMIYPDNVAVYLSSIYIHLSSSFYQYMDTPQPHWSVSGIFQRHISRIRSIDIPQKATVERGESGTSRIRRCLQKSSKHDGCGWICMDIWAN